jgi:hypothetical protein
VFASLAYKTGTRQQDSGRGPAGSSRSSKTLGRGNAGVANGSEQARDGRAHRDAPDGPSRAHGRCCAAPCTAPTEHARVHGAGSRSRWRVRIRPRRRPIPFGALNRCDDCPDRWGASGDHRRPRRIDPMTGLALALLLPAARPPSPRARLPRRAPRRGGRHRHRLVRDLRLGGSGQRGRGPGPRPGRRPLAAPRPLPREGGRLPCPPRAPRRGRAPSHDQPRHEALGAGGGDGAGRGRHDRDGRERRARA